MAELALKGQVALISGAAKRIGRSIALKLAAAGARVAVNYRGSEADARETVQAIGDRGGGAVAIAADVSQAAECVRLVKAVEKQVGPVDILVNNAGIFAAYEWDKITESEWDRFMNTNLKAQFFCTQAAAPGMKKRGRGCIVNLASLGGIKVWPAFIPYSVSKAGVIHLTRLLARALGPEIRVNAVAPGTIQFEGEEPDQNYIRRVPLGRVGRGEDIAEAVLYLCTTASYVTGQILAVDGGDSLV